MSDRKDEDVRATPSTTDRDERAIQWHVYRPHFKGYDPPLDRDRCAESVHNGGRSPTFHQCLFKGVVEIGGYRWCRRHAKGVAESVARTKNTKETSR